MKRWILSTFGLGVGLSGMVVHAHHSIAAVYDNSQRVTIEGVVTRFQFINPHPLVVVEVKDADGKGLQWTLEMDNRWELVEIGVDNLTLKPGDRIVVTGSPGRTQPRSLYIRRLERPADGFSYQQIGQRPSIGSTTSQPRQ